MRHEKMIRATSTVVFQGLLRSWLPALCLLALIFSAEITAQTAASYRKRATEMSRAKSWDDAIANYRSALALEPNDSVTHYDLAQALKYKGDTREAVKEFGAALELRPKWADAHYGLGAALYDLQDQIAAAKELRAAETLDPANAATHRLLARILSQRNNPTDAEHELRLALRSKPSAETYVDLGVVEGQLMGVYLKSVVPEVPEFDDGQNRLQWKFRASRAQGTIDDEISVAFG